MNHYAVDLHIHSLLSPCADLYMSPQVIVERAVSKRLDAIAVCDHNSLHQLPVLQTLCEQANLTLFNAGEITTKEELQLLAVLPDQSSCCHMQTFIDHHIIKLPYSSQLMGEQVWVDANEQIDGEGEGYLNAPLKASLEEVVHFIHSVDGLAVAAHVDRPSYSIRSQLGFIPKGLILDGVEYHNKERLKQMILLQPSLNEKALYTASDAHFPEQIGSNKSILRSKDLSFDELRKALHLEDDRNLISMNDQQT